jgi:tetratricopeptide (TPR) repeat protein
MLWLAAVLVTTTSGCSSLGFLPGFGNQGASGRVDAKPEQVVDELSSARTHMQLAPREPYWPFRMGELYAASDSTAQAVSFLNAALGVDPSYAPAAVLLSRLYYDAKMHAQAVDLLDDFLARNPVAPDALRAALALHLEALGEIERAQSVLTACTSESRDAHVARTMIALNGSDAAAALAATKQALDAEASAANYNNYGIALLYSGRPIEARDAFGKALAVNPQLPGALYNLAIVETFYFFDEAAGREWFARYRQYASEDPDNLKGRFEADVSKTQKVRD